MSAAEVLRRVTLLPQPRRMVAGEGARAAGGFVAGVIPDAFGALAPAIRDGLAALTGGAPDAAAVPVGFVADLAADHGPEAYTLAARDGSVAITAATALGALHAVRTLADLWAQTRPALPDVTIEDAPTYAHRGIFVESVWGSDRMELADWTWFVDRMADLKMNTLGVSLHGCWDLRYEGETSEFLFVPLRDFPQLRSPHRVRAWDPATGAPVVHEGLPRMFEDDLLGEVVAHARAQGVTTLPVLGGPGHSSLIPRLVPELAARDAEGTIVGYGYCVSGDEARATLARLFANVADQHVLAYGLDVLGCAADEFYPIANVDPHDPLRVVSPYCQCSGCARLTPGEQLVEYLVIAARVLAERGVRMLVWQDSLVRMGVVDLLVERLTAAGLPLPTMSWWAYHDPIPDLEVGALETWVTPSPAFIATLFLQDMSPNIEAWARAGAAKGATGILAYNVPDPAVHRGYALLADLAWNLEGSGGAHGFAGRWAARLAPDRTDDARFALEQADSILRCYPLMTYLLDHLMPYFSTSPRGVIDYPADQVRVFLPPSPAMAGILRQVRDTLRDAIRRMPAETASVPGWPDPAQAWRDALTRIADHTDLFLGLVDAARVARSLDDAAFAARVAALEAAGERLLHHVAATNAAWLIPVLLREHLGLVEGLRPTLERFRATDADAPPEPWHAWLI
ncbi:MAG: glycoside hydrolase family 20 zincin-like fold domain-containing protein [Chloroflexota bacterium]